MRNIFSGTLAWGVAVILGGGCLFNVASVQAATWTGWNVIDDTFTRTATDFANSGTNYNAVVGTTQPGLVSPWVQTINGTGQTTPTGVYPATNGYLTMDMTGATGGLANVSTGSPVFDNTITSYTYDTGLTVNTFAGAPQSIRFVDVRGPAAGAANSILMAYIDPNQISVLNSGGGYSQFTPTITAGTEYTFRFIVDASTATPTVSIYQETGADYAGTGPFTLVAANVALYDAAIPNQVGPTVIYSGTGLQGSLSVDFIRMGVGVAIPEPASLSMGLLGLGIIALGRRRARQPV